MMLVSIRKDADIERHLRGRVALPSQLVLTTSISPGEEDIELLFHPKLKYLELWFGNEAADNSDPWWVTHLRRTTKLRALTKMCLRSSCESNNLPRSFPKLCFSSILCSTLKEMVFWSLQYRERVCFLLGRALPSLSNLCKLTVNGGHFHGPLGRIITAAFGVPECKFGAFVHTHKSSLVVLNSISQGSLKKKGGQRTLYVWAKKGDLELPLLKLIAAAIEKCPTTEINRSSVVEVFRKDDGLLEALEYMFL